MWRAFLMLSTPMPGKHLPRAPRAAGQHAVHHVDAPRHGTDDIVRLAHAHQVARLVLGQHVGRVIETSEHRLLPLAHGQTPDGIAVKTDLAQRLGASGASPALARPAGCRKAHDRAGRQRRLWTALAHRIDMRMLSAMRSRSAGSAGHSSKHITMSLPSKLLDFHRALGRDLVLRAVDMAFEGHAAFGQLAQPGKAHHLKAAADPSGSACPNS